MDILKEFSDPIIHWAIGTTVLIGLVSTEFSGIGTVIALSISSISVTLTALCGTSLNLNEHNYKKRKLSDCLEFFQIWIEILEVLAVVATCARMASATVDYISNGRLKEWFLGIESHSLGEPWPDIIGVLIVIVITALFMLGLERSLSFSFLLLFGILGTFLFFLIAGSTHIQITFIQWTHDLKHISFYSILTAAGMCSYGFVNTLPNLKNFRKTKILAIFLIPLCIYTTIIMIFTMMSNYKELSGTATPLLRVFQLRDVDMARLVMALWVIFVVCLALTEILPILYELFLTLSSGQWQIFLSSLQFRHSISGAPLLVIFAAGSLAAILAFACPLYYLIRLINISTLVKCTIRSIHVIYNRYKPEFNNDTYLVNNNPQYSKLKSTKSMKNSSNILFCCKKSKSFGGTIRKNPNSKPLEDSEYLLLNDYCDKAVNLAVSEDISDSDDNDDDDDDNNNNINDNNERESVLSYSINSDSDSTDIDVAVQEYEEKIRIATVDSFNSNKRPNLISITFVMVLVLIKIGLIIYLNYIIYKKNFVIFWSCIGVLLVLTIIILLMPKNTLKAENELLSKSLTIICAIISMEMNLLLTITLIEDVWIGILFWFIAGILLFWRYKICICDNLLNQRRIYITDNIPQIPEYVDTILIAR